MEMLGLQLENMNSMYSDRCHNIRWQFYSKVCQHFYEKSVCNSWTDWNHSKIYCPNGNISPSQPYPSFSESEIFNLIYSAKNKCKFPVLQNKGFVFILMSYIFSGSLPFRPFSVQKVISTNLILVAVNSLCPCESRKVDIEPVEVEHNETTSCNRLLMQHYRKRPQSCVNYHPDVSITCH